MNKKPTKKQSTLRRLMKYLKPHGGLLALAFLCAVITAAAMLFTPVVIGEAVDCIVSKGNVNFEKLAIYLCVLAGLIAAVLLFQWLMNLCANRAAHLAVADARKAGFAAVTDAPLSYVDTQSQGDIAARISVDADQIADGIVQGATQIFTGVVTIIGTLVFMIRISPWIALAVAALTPLSLLVSYFVARGSHKYFTQQTAVRGELYSHTEETVRSRTLVAAYDYSERAERDFDTTNTELKKCGFKALCFSSLVNPSTRLINSLVYAVAAVMGTVFAINGQVTVGGITQLLLYANQFARPLNEITGVITEFQTSLAAAKRILDLTEVKPQDDSGAELKSDGNIAVSNLDFSYVPERPLIQDMNIAVEKGTLVAIVGRTGCGKTTLINLLMRFYDPDSGQILFDDVNAEEFSRSSIRKNFGMVLQDSWIFKGTVRDNIAYGKPNATDEEIKAAARAADIDGFIERLPNGYDTVIDDGDGISQGQKQLINIARIMLVDPPMLILDEATSNIDTRTEKRVQAAFDRLLRPENGNKKTGFVVAHRLSTIVHADIILVMDKGQIIERGTHTELLKKNGAYASLYQAQFARTEDTVKA
ncbi:MAG: ABC transporter ATP-binding protein/permease [Clostridiales bacterium]|nr:ABC transporter ATP-binding protein/permease [Clostridiales bacterium]